MVVTTGKGVGGMKGKERQIYGDGRWFDIGGGHTMQYTDQVEIYTWNLYNLINQCHPQKPI